MRSPRRTRPLSNCCPERPACRPVAWLTCSFRCRPATAVSVAWIVGGGPNDGRWRLEGGTGRYEDVEGLRADNAALVLSFIDRVFGEENVRAIAAGDLINRLDDELYAVN